MARKPTIFKFAIALSDTDAGRYLDLNLTVAQHPSETVERMMVRVLVYCLNARDGLELTKGLSDNDEPDLWRRSLDGRILDWIEVGEPGVDRIRKASGLAEQVLVYSFNSKSDHWWQQSAEQMSALGAQVYQLAWDEVQQLGALAERTLALSVTVTDQSAFVATDRDSLLIHWRALTAG
ncbi:MAG: YaeQ family protein [Pseudomonadales bacterium]